MTHLHGGANMKGVAREYVDIMMLIFLARDMC